MLIGVRSQLFCFERLAKGEDYQAGKHGADELLVLIF